MNADTYEYQVGGSLPPTAPSYVHRQADEQLFQALLRGQFCNVLTARQMGKSSLRVRTMQRLQQAGICCGVLDMTVVGAHQLSITQWYASIIHRLINAFELPTAFREWWAEHETLSPIECLSEFIETELLGHIASPVVLFIDEIDSTLQLSFSADDFFALIRACYNRRSDQPQYQRLTFALIGVAIPSDLISNPIATPFNIGQAIALRGLSYHEAHPLLPGLQSVVMDADRVLRDVLSWTGGQPFLTQKICRLITALANQESSELDTVSQTSVSQVSEHPSLANEVLSYKPIENSQRENLQHEHSQQITYHPDVSEIVQACVIDNWETQDRPEHLKTIRARLLYLPQITGHALAIYQQLLDQETVLTDESLAQLTLRLSGLVIDEYGELRIANAIYRAVFNASWVARQLDRLRPYAATLNSWVASNYSEKENLLTGVPLQEALAWAATKQLGEADYRFLSASQAYAKQAVESHLADTQTELAHEIEERAEAEFALTSALAAKQLLDRARHKARSRATGLRAMGRRLGSITLAVTTLIGGVRVVGTLQALEWGALDQFFRWRPPAIVDPRIVIITIDEPDIQTIGQFPIPDQLLAETITTLNQYEPRLIGLDIYRDFPVEPGHEALVSVLRQTPNLYGIKKAIGTEILPPPALDPERVGFADQIADEDGTIRRALLSIQSKQPQSANIQTANDTPEADASSTAETVESSFPLALAIAYLEAEGITARSLSVSPTQTQLGKQIIRPFRAYDGGYVRADAGGYQMLLNYRGSQEQFSTFSITQVLAGEVSPAAIHDRIVLIGSTASTINNLLITPYTSGPGSYMPGVTVHANTISMLLSSALDDQPFLRVWPKWVEGVWIFLWAGAGTIIVGQVRRRPLLTVTLLVASIVLLTGSTYVLFLQNWWVPVIPAGLGIVLTAIAVPIATARQLQRGILLDVVQQLAEECRQQPAIGKIAIAYLIDSEEPDEQRWIEQIMTKETGENAIEPI